MFLSIFISIFFTTQIFASEDSFLLKETLQSVFSTTKKCQQENCLYINKLCEDIDKSQNQYKLISKSIVKKRDILIKQSGSKGLQNYIKRNVNQSCDVLFCRNKKFISSKYCPRRESKRFSLYEECLKFTEEPWSEEFEKRKRVVTNQLETLKRSYKKIIQNRFKRQPKISESLQCILDSIQVIPPTSKLLDLEDPSISGYSARIEKVNKETTGPFCLRKNYIPVIRLGSRVFGNPKKNMTILAHEIAHLIAPARGCRHQINGKESKGLIKDSSGNYLNTYEVWSKEHSQIKQLPPLKFANSDILNPLKELRIEKLGKLQAFTAQDALTNEAFADYLGTKAILNAYSDKPETAINIIKSHCTQLNPPYKNDDLHLLRRQHKGFHGTNVDRLEFFMIQANLEDLGFLNCH